MSTSTKSELLDWIKAIVIAIGIAFFLHTFVFATSVVQGESMYPTLQDGERVIFNKLIYLIDEPERGEIVIIQRPSKNYVKRVIGLPNETIEVRDHTLYINGNSKHIGANQDFINNTTDFGPIIIPEGSYFVMGDNRSISKDSRNGLGFISEDEIIGRSEFIIFPFSEVSRTN